MPPLALSEMKYLARLLMRTAMQMAQLSGLMLSPAAWQALVAAVVQAAVYVAAGRSCWMLACRLRRR